MNQADHWATLTDAQLIDRFAGVTVWRANGQRAPHRPLLILWSLARLQRGESRLIAFADFDEPFRKLLRNLPAPEIDFRSRAN